MKTRQTIAVIGATGNMGSAISRSLAKGNNRLLLIASTPENARMLAEQIKSENALADVEAIECSVEASWEADIIIAAVPYEAEKALAEKIREMANQKIVISISNPLNSTYNGLVTSPDTSSVEELQKLLPNSKVVKAINNRLLANFSTPLIDGKKVDVFIAGDDQEALKTVSELVSTAGFNPIINK